MEGLHQVTVSFFGKDARFWRGEYGSKIFHCSIWVLETEEELEGVFVCFCTIIYGEAFTLDMLLS